MTFDLARLGRPDVEALAALKLAEELGLGAATITDFLRRVDEGWMRRFIASGPAAIGDEPLGIDVLMRARVYRLRARHVRSRQ